MGRPAWAVREEWWPQALEVPLWFREVELLVTPELPEVPGPLDVDPGELPAPGAGADRTGWEEAWLAWWRTALLGAAAGTGAEAELPGPLGRAVAARVQEALRWQEGRKKAGMDVFLAGRGRELTVTRTVAELEEELGREARAFDAELVMLPVLEDEVRRVGPAKWLVPERVRLGPDWPDVARRLLEPLV
ncbi:hypothetical protein BIV57_22410 [Mangrovactinospora gilvigrisea]|uniref:Uncharacterized protein n=2 Tax=Mangrovactinospora gilvigrisea TaxID=1428644 RepID=A0A1J7C129_9ACTN|nr:hypothetical protein BIV57_22410 [Mangrovactinospora gilvigrisea]